MSQQEWNCSVGVGLNYTLPNTLFHTQKLKANEKRARGKRARLNIMLVLLI